MFPLAGVERRLFLHRLLQLHRRTSLLLGGGRVRFSDFGLNETNEIGGFVWRLLTSNEPSLLSSAVLSLLAFLAAIASTAFDVVVTS